MTQDTTFDQDMERPPAVGAPEFERQDPDATPRAAVERADNEELRQQLAQFKDFRVGSFIEGLGLQWRNANTIRISSGRFGAGDEMFELKSNTELPIANAGTSQFLYIFLGVNDSDREKVQPFFSKDFAGGNEIKGFTRGRRIGTIFLDSTGAIEEFVQCGEFNNRRVTVRDSILVLSGVIATFTLAAATTLPAGLCSFGFQVLYEKSGGNAEILIYATPELESETTPPAVSDTRLVAGSSGRKLVDTFTMHRDRENGIWVAYTPAPDLTAQFRLRYWEEDV